MGTAGLMKIMSKDGYLLTEAGNIDSGSMSRYVGKNWVHETALSVDKFFDWQLKRYPGGNGINRSLVISDEKTEEIYGFFGIIPREFILDGALLKGTELTTWMVSEEIRGKSFASGMLTYLMSKYDFVCAVGGVTQAALHVYKRMGFKNVRLLPRFYKVYNIERTKRISNITDFGLRLLNNVRIDEKSRSNVEEFSPASRYRNFYKGWNCFGRSIPHIEWRYINHPYFRYNVFVVNPNSEREVFVVLRVQELEEIRLCHLIDFYGYEAGFPGALSFVDSFCLSRGVDFVDFYCSATNITKYFWTSGWFSVADDPEISIPHLFNPIELRNPPTVNIIMHAPRHLTQLCDTGRLYITKGDGDLDKPTLPYLRKNNLI